MNNQPQIRLFWAYFIPIIGFYLIPEHVRENPTDWRVGVVAIYNLAILVPPFIWPMQ